MNTLALETFNHIKNTMHLPYKKAIIFLDGVSSKVKTEEVMQTICQALRALNIPYSFYNAPKMGFVKLKQDMNEPDTLYILNDSASYHLCDQPNVFVTRTPFWVQSNPKPNTIGIFTQERLENGPAELIACIAKNTPVRQPFDHTATHTYIITNDYPTDDLGVMARHGVAAISWDLLTAWDIHVKVLFHQSKDKELPMVNRILAEGLEMLENPDDIIIFINRDICLTKESTTIIRNYMDTNHINAVYSRRRDVQGLNILQQNDLEKYPKAPGADLFAFRKNAACLKKILPVDLYIGRVLWDSFWMHEIVNELPCPVSYHPIHESTWQGLKDGKTEFNIQNVFNVAPELRMKYRNNGELYAPIPL
jgi:hypothetical protein